MFHSKCVNKMSLTVINNALADRLPNGRPSPVLDVSGQFENSIKIFYIEKILDNFDAIKLYNENYN